MSLITLTQQIQNMVSVLPAVLDCKLLLFKYIWSFRLTIAVVYLHLKNNLYALYKWFKSQQKKYIMYITILKIYIFQCDKYSPSCSQRECSFTNPATFLCTAHNRCEHLSNISFILLRYFSINWILLLTKLLK